MDYSSRLDGARARFESGSWFRRTNARFERTVNTATGAWASYRGPEPKITHRRPNLTPIRDPRFRRASQVIRAHRQRLITRHRARALFGLSSWGFRGWLLDAINWPAFHVMQAPPGYGPEIMSELPLLRTPTEIAAAHKQGLISRHEARMMQPETGIGEGLAWWLLDSRLGYVCALGVIGFVIVFFLIHAGVLK